MMRNVIMIMKELQLKEIQCSYILIMYRDS